MLLHVSYIDDLLSYVNMPYDIFSYLVTITTPVTPYNAA